MNQYKDFILSECILLRFFTTPLSFFKTVPKFYRVFFSSVLWVNRTLVDSCLRNPGDPCAASLDPGRSHSRQVGCSASLDIGRSHTPQLCCSILLWFRDPIAPIWNLARVKLSSAMLFYSLVLWSPCHQIGPLQESLSSGIFCYVYLILVTDLLLVWTLWQGVTLVRYLFCILDSRDLVWPLVGATLLR